MTIRKLNRPLASNRDFDQFFTDFFHKPVATINEGKKKLFGEAPAVNISESDKSFDIDVAAPGMIKSDFTIEINEGVLAISSEQKEETKERGENFTRREFNYSTFERRFTLPENVEEQKVKASYTDGILRIEIPKVKVEDQKNKKRLIAIS